MKVFVCIGCLAHREHEGKRRPKCINDRCEKFGEVMEREEDFNVSNISPE